jgi:hypothetical protein
VPCTYLVSTPCQMTHEFHSETVTVYQMIKNLGDYAHLAHPGPFERHFYALEIQTSQTAAGFAFNLDVDKIVGILSLWYGKDIINHGPIITDGVLSLPDLLNLAPNVYFSLPVYGGQHIDPPATECNWKSLAQIQSLLGETKFTHDKTHTIVKAAKCYSQALRLFPIDREIAYLRLIQSLECVVDKTSFSDEELFSHDKELWSHIRWLESLEQTKGAKVAKFVKGRLYQITRSVLLWVKQYLDDGFFVSASFSLTADELELYIPAAYSLRSKYVHSGIAFGDFVDPVDGRCERFERIPDYFCALCPDTDLRKTLNRAPTFLGLQRLVRYCLLKYLEKENL